MPRDQLQPERPCGKPAANHSSSQFSHYPRHLDQELSLRDLIDMIIRRKKLVSVIFAVILVIGVAIALLMPAKLQYSQFVKLANYKNESGQVVTLESANQVQAKMQAIVLPIMNSKANKGDVSHSIKVQLVQSDTGTSSNDTATAADLLQLNSTSRTNSDKQVNAAFQKLLTNLNQQQSNLYSQKQAYYKSKLSQTQIQLNVLQNNYREDSKMLKKLLDEPVSKTQALTTSNSLVNIGPSDAHKLLSDELINTQQQLALNITNAKLQIASYETTLKSFIPNKMMSSMIAMPTGLTVDMRVLLALLFASIAAVMAAFLAESLKRP